MEIDCVRARLRKGKDDDLKRAFSKIPDHYDQSYIVREALRQFFFSSDGRVPLFTTEQLFNEGTIVKPQHRAHISNAELEFKPLEIQLTKVDDEIDLDKAIDSVLD